MMTAIQANIHIHTMVFDCLVFAPPTKIDSASMNISLDKSVSVVCFYHLLLKKNLIGLNKQCLIKPNIDGPSLKSFHSFYQTRPKTSSNAYDVCFTDLSLSDQVSLVSSFLLVTET